MSTQRLLAEPLLNWLQQHADALDQGQGPADELLPRLGQAGLLRLGVPSAIGGADGTIGDAIEAIAQVAEHSLTAAFVFWGQRTFIDYVVNSDSPAPRERWLPALLTGELAGATGLSNAMKFLSQIEQLQIQAKPDTDTDPEQPGSLRLNGGLPWVTNLQPRGFVVAAAVDMGAGQPPAVVAIESGRTGVQRTPDLGLVALRDSRTAALKLQDVVLPADQVLARHGPDYLRRIRPHFLGMQCGMSIGLARAALAASRAACGPRTSLQAPLQALEHELNQATAALQAGVASGQYATQAAPLFELRIALAGLVQTAVQLELQATGGRAYLQGQAPGFARRWLEAAFVPVVTPSLTQLQAELARQRAQAAPNTPAAPAVATA
ncbi:MAG: acyl-CoA/acyl-ACP dehydrogenase [Curvibacter lanceolatus]|jgi:alkylation response protein AidB-like acyl-CoA dehydrogenase|uniref:acyl-CoA dehydrogenase family protein n=1 Tax=Curvibacter lanceolatus TaxID=86182 RepID=UPI00035F8BEA|nr:acyl-CoA dehydrogenase family protein [Curvibacter lanceolatus]MBV5293497.1 acyl-CoA/acyl-ACP dehydrogenase [Curvibacter lanceolatus]